MTSKCQYFGGPPCWWFPWDIYNLFPTPFHRHLGKGLYTWTLIRHLIPQCKGRSHFQSPFAISLEMQFHKRWDFKGCWLLSHSPETGFNSLFPGSLLTHHLGKKHSPTPSPCPHLPCWWASSLCYLVHQTSFWLAHPPGLPTPQDLPRVSKKHELHPFRVN